MYWYNLLPANIFGAFGDVDRADLLQSQGATYDKNRGFIEVMAPGDPNKNDVEKLQVKLFQGQQGIMVGRQPNRVESAARAGRAGVFRAQ